MSFYGPKRPAAMVGPKFYTGNKGDSAVVRDQRWKSQVQGEAAFLRCADKAVMAFQLQRAMPPSARDVQRRYRGLAQAAARTKAKAAVKAARDKTQKLRDTLAHHKKLARQAKAAVAKGTRHNRALRDKLQAAGVLPQRSTRLSQRGRPVRDPGHPAVPASRSPAASPARARASYPHTTSTPLSPSTRATPRTAAKHAPSPSPSPSPSLSPVSQHHAGGAAQGQRRRQRPRSAAPLRRSGSRSCRRTGSRGQDHGSFQRGSQWTASSVTPASQRTQGGQQRNGWVRGAPRTASMSMTELRATCVGAVGMRDQTRAQPERQLLQRVLQASKKAQSELQRAKVSERAIRDDIAEVRQALTSARRSRRRPQSALPSMRQRRRTAPGSEGPAPTLSLSARTSVGQPDSHSVTTQRSTLQHTGVLPTQPFDTVRTEEAAQVHAQYLRLLAGSHTAAVLRKWMQGASEGNTLAEGMPSSSRRRGFQEKRSQRLRRQDKAQLLKRVNQNGGAGMSQRLKGLLSTTKL